MGVTKKILLICADVSEILLAILKYSLSIKSTWPNKHSYHVSSNLIDFEKFYDHIQAQHARFLVKISIFLPKSLVQFWPIDPVLEKLDK